MLLFVTARERRLANLRSLTSFTNSTGTLEFWDFAVIFRFSYFKENHLNLSIPVLEIEMLSECLVYDLARNGLRVQNKNVKSDLFVPEDARTFKKALLEQMNHLK